MDEEGEPSIRQKIDLTSDDEDDDPTKKIMRLSFKDLVLRQGFNT